MAKQIGTVFTRASQTTKINKPGAISIHDLSSVELISPAGLKMIEHTAPRSAFEVEGGKVKSGSAAHDQGMRSGGGGGSTKIGTVFTEATTNHNPEPTLPLMTEKSAAQAKKAAPRNAFKTTEDK
jgi:hypothetical protein